MKFDDFFKGIGNSRKKNKKGKNFIWITLILFFSLVIAITTHFSDPDKNNSVSYAADTTEINTTRKVLKNTTRNINTTKSNTTNKTVLNTTNETVEDTTESIFQDETAAIEQVSYENTTESIDTTEEYIEDTQAEINETEYTPEITQVEYSESSRIVFWVPNGKSYHSSEGCPTLSRSKTILNGPLSSCPKGDPCDRCMY